ncbi:MAG TPA: hypothetical protein VLY82_02765 [Nitrososphaerales archaeon]|nr:hypothetical protein [Nitrososphaerales archaeon]
MRLPDPLTLVFAILAIWGLAWTIADSHISLPFRKAIAKATGEESLVLIFLECPGCLSFWLGLGAGLALGMRWLAIAFGLVCCGLSALFFSYLNRES